MYFQWLEFLSSNGNILLNYDLPTPAITHMDLSKTELELLPRVH